jgi:tetraacyldisaccharide 4'-kinase
MDEAKIREVMSGADRSLGARLVRCGLQIAAGPYWLGAWVNRRLYRWGLRKPKRAGVGVICVGNLTTGGTGKTPMVIWVVRKLRKLGATPAVLTRGYRANEQGSDEAGLISKLTDAQVIVDPDRHAGAQRAIDLGADVLVMDDGFTHLKLARDLNIVLIDATNPFGYGHVLPRGMAREPRSSLHDADEIVITRSDMVEPTQLEALTQKLERLTGGKQIHWAQHRPQAVIDENGQRCKPEVLAGRAVYAFAGIARPEQFFRTLGQLGARVVGQQSFDDHAVLSPDELSGLNQAAELSPAQVLITTEKDAIRLDRSALTLPLWQLAVEMDLLDADTHISRRIRDVARQGGKHQAWRQDTGL